VGDALSEETGKGRKAAGECSSGWFCGKLGVMTDKPYKLSRSKIDLFTECQRCFYLDQKLKIKRPGGPPFLLNSAVDQLLKQEFDVSRAKGEAHPLMKAYGIEAVPAQHEDINRWRHNFTGVQYIHPETGFLIFGAIDDVWVNPDGEYLIVDYKATSKNVAAETHEDLWPGFLKQMEVYQWLFTSLGHKVSKTGYFVNCNGKKDADAFDGKLEFDITIIPYTGDFSWVEPTIVKIKDCLKADNIPLPAENCQYCNYRKRASQQEVDLGV
jgi:hypothetical protein